VCSIVGKKKYFNFCRDVKGAVLLKRKAVKFIVFHKNNFRTKPDRFLKPVRFSEVIYLKNYIWKNFLGVDVQKNKSCRFLRIYFSEPSERIAKLELLRNVHEISSTTKPDRFWKPVRFDSTYLDIISCTFLRYHIVSESPDIGVNIKTFIFLIRCIQ